MWNICWVLVYCILPWWQLLLLVNFKWGLSEHEAQPMPSLTEVFQDSASRSLNPAPLFSPPAPHPGCQTHVISLPGLPSALERHKRLLWHYQQPLWLTSTHFLPTNPFPQRGTLNYCLHLICSLSTKLLSASHFPPHLYALALAQCLCACMRVYVCTEGLCLHTLETVPVCICLHLKISMTISIITPVCLQAHVYLFSVHSDLQQKWWRPL